ncbi:MAG: hypothetical protein WD904_07710 [Dehalococcoidia bacterium]
MPNERHNDDRNIVMDDLKQAAEASEISVDEVVQNIQDGYESGEKATSGKSTARS